MAGHFLGCFVAFCGQGLRTVLLAMLETALSRSAVGTLKDPSTKLGEAKCQPILNDETRTGIAEDLSLAGKLSHKLDK